MYLPWCNLLLQILIWDICFLFSLLSLHIRPSRQSTLFCCKYFVKFASNSIIWWDFLSFSLRQPPVSIPVWKFQELCLYGFVFLSVLIPLTIFFLASFLPSHFPSYLCCSLPVLSCPPSFLSISHLFHNMYQGNKARYGNGCRRSIIGLFESRQLCHWSYLYCSSWTESC